jgi:hypothetical protein
MSSLSIRDLPSHLCQYQWDARSFGHDRLGGQQVAMPLADALKHGHVGLGMLARGRAAGADQRVVGVGMGDLEAEAAENDLVIAILTPHRGFGSARGGSRRGRVLQRLNGRTPRLINSNASGDNHGWHYRLSRSRGQPYREATVMCISFLYRTVAVRR